MTTDDLNILEYNSYYQGYIDMAKDLDFIHGFKISLEETENLLNNLDEEKLLYRYKPEKWTIKEILQHLMDTERIFAYRALRIAREDKTPMPGFEQDDYILPSKANDREIDVMLKEYETVRNSTISLFNSFPSESYTNKGVASNSDISVRALGFMIIGHERHHCEIIRQRYL